MSKMNEHDTELEHALQSHYQQFYGEAPAPEQLWQRIAPLLGSQEQSAIPWWKQLLRMHNSSEILPLTPSIRRPARKFSPRLAIVLASLLALLLLVGTGYAAIGPAVFGDIFKNLGFQHQLQTNQFTDYHQSKSIDGYTLTIRKVYADANQIAIAYTGEMPSGGIAPFFKFEEGLVKLTTEQGIELPPIGGETTTPMDDANGTLFVFDAARIQNAPKELHLRLTIPYNGAGKSSSHIQGYLTFNFSVPFHPGVVTNLSQSITAHGTTLTLERVVVAPSGVRIYMNGLHLPDNVVMLGLMDYNLFIGGQEDKIYSIFNRSGEWYLDCARPSSFDAHTPWTLVFQQSQFYQTKDGKTMSAPIKGATWTFHFVVS